MDGEGQLGSRPAGGRVGRENMGPLGGDVPRYGTCRRRWGGRTDTNPFRYLQYLEHIERRVGISIEGDGAIKCGFGGLLEDKTVKLQLHKEVSQVKLCF